VNTVFSVLCSCFVTVTGMMAGDHVKNIICTVCTVLIHIYVDRRMGE
jgi:hypothetical protein